MSHSGERTKRPGTGSLGSPRTMNMLVRRQVFSVWRGPRAIEASIDATTQFWGWQTLSLDRRTDHGLDPELESRSVYGVVHNESEDLAILRAVYWNHATARELMKQGGFNYTFGMPARFVRVAADQLRDWISRFSGVVVPISPTWGRNVPESVRRLRIESDYYSSVLEVTWEDGAAAFEELGRRWETVWAEMTEALQATPVVTEISEEFAHPEGTPRYDLKAYRPDAFGSQPD